MREHTKKLSAIERTLNAATGSTTQKRRRMLTQNRQLLLSVLQSHPELAENIHVQVPECDFSKCTMCGDCVDACPLHACDLVDSGRFALEATYCVGCGLCADVCETRALTMVERDARDLVLPDPEVKQGTIEAVTSMDAGKLAAEAKKGLSTVLDQVEKLAD